MGACLMCYFDPCVCKERAEQQEREWKRRQTLGPTTHIFSSGDGHSLSEKRITDPTTGGQKGQKLCQIGAVDPLALVEVGKVAGFGGEKYERYNFAKGYKWSLNYDALQRHLMAFWSGEDIDPESKLPHLAHAAWHCLALLTFWLRKKGTDDRFPR